MKHPLKIPAFMFVMSISGLILALNGEGLWNVLGSGCLVAPLFWCGSVLKSAFGNGYGKKHAKNQFE